MDRIVALAGDVAVIIHDGTLLILDARGTAGDSCWQLCWLGTWFRHICLVMTLKQH